MKPACRECWDPVDKEDAELCDWCAMTPEQRKASLRRSLAWLFIATTIFISAIFIGGLDQ